MKTKHILYDLGSKKVLRRNPHGGIGLPATLYLEEGEPVPNPNPEAKRIPGGYAPRPVNLVYLKDLPRPTFDPSTHTIDGQTIDEQARTRSWVVRPLTPEEIAARQPQSVRRVPFQMALREILGLLFTDLEAYINAMPDPLERDLALIRFHGEQNILLDDQLLLYVASTMEANAALPINPATITAELPEGSQYTAAEAVEAVFAKAFEIERAPTNQ